MKTYKIEIENDECSESPREWDNITTMVCFHKRYNLGDKHDVNFNDYNSWEEMEEAIKAEGDILMMKPLYLYDHSGITISTKPFGDRFDSGRVGLIYISELKFKALCGDIEVTQERLKEILEGEVETYDKYIRGEVYRYSIYEVEECSLGHQHENLLDSCGGYYDEDEARSEAESIVKHYKDETAIAYHS